MSEGVYEGADTEWYVVVNEDLKINYRGIDLERCSEALQPGRIFGKGPTAQAAEAAAMSAMKARLERQREIDLRKAACE